MENESPSNKNHHLDSIPATREIINTLFSHKLISNEARKYGIQLLYPTHNWGFWAAKLLSILGIALILSGIIYFLTFNWDKMTPLIKFTLIQTGIIACIITSFFCVSKLIAEKFSLLSAGILVGVFLFIFGQIYQTGADSYNLFMIWALLILPWVIISKFAIFWAHWLFISNTAFMLFWIQAALPKPEADMMLFPYLILFNSLFLLLREFLCTKNTNWLQGRWTRMVLVILILALAIFPTMVFSTNPLHATYSTILATLVSIIIHIAFYFIYRYKIPDISVIAATILSVCIILESFIYETLTQLLTPKYSIIYLLIGAITPFIFTLAIIVLRTIAKKMEKTHV